MIVAAEGAEMIGHPVRDYALSAGSRNRYAAVVAVVEVVVGEPDDKHIHHPWMRRLDTFSVPCPSYAGLGN